jgi:Na+/H+-dicarboxylate symporter
MELIGVILFCLILGIIIRKKGDNTMDTLSKGCGCFSILFFLVVGLIIWMLIEGY